MCGVSMSRWYNYMFPIIRARNEMRGMAEVLWRQGREVRVRPSKLPLWQAAPGSLQQKKPPRSWKCKCPPLVTLVGDSATWVELWIVR